MNIVCSIPKTGKTVEITAHGFDEKHFDAEEVSILVDGVQRDDFGTTFIGQDVTSFDVFKQVVLAYVNNNEDYVFEEVSEELEALKERLFEGVISVGGHVFPKTYYYDCFSIIPLPARIITDVGAAYTDGDYYVAVDKKGGIETDIEPFWTEYVLHMYRGYQSLYIDKETERWLESFED